MGILGRTAHFNGVRRAVMEAKTAAGTVCRLQLWLGYAIVAVSRPNRAVIAAFTAGVTDHTLLCQTAFREYGLKVPGQLIGASGQSVRRASAQTIPAKSAIRGVARRIEIGLRVAPLAFLQQLCRAGCNAIAAAGTARQKFAFRKCPGRAQNFPVALASGA